MKRALIFAFAVFVLCAGGALGGYWAGVSRGADLEAARARGTAQGERAGSARGTREGYRRGIRGGRRKGYREAYEEGHIRVTGDPGIQKLIAQVIVRHEDRAQTRKAKSAGE